MITTIDRGKDGNDWAMIDYETDEIVYDESGVRKPLTTSDIMVQRGKYAGYKLSEVNNSGYLKFIMKNNPEDEFIKDMFTRRLGELE